MRLSSAIDGFLLAKRVAIRHTVAHRVLIIPSILCAPNGGRGRTARTGDPGERGALPLDAIAKYGVL